MWKISVAFILVAASATFYLTSSFYQGNKRTTTQSTYFDDVGKLHVMGITLGESTFRDAEKAFRSRADAAIFLYPLANKDKETVEYRGELEAYFPSIADHSKVLLKMKINAASLEAMRQRSGSPRVYPNGVMRMNLSSQDILAVRKMIINELTLIPSTQLDVDMLHAQFGKPEDTQSANMNESTYHFPRFGLTAVIHKDEKDKLIFSNNRTTPKTK